MKFVLTGRCVLNASNGGRHIERPELVRMITNAGHSVGPTVRADTSYLVGGRTDTMKARRAREMGIMTISYDGLMGLLNATSVSRQPARFADGRLVPLNVPDAGRMAPRDALVSEFASPTMRALAPEELQCRYGDRRDKGRVTESGLKVSSTVRNTAIGSRGKRALDI